MNTKEFLNNVCNQIKYKPATIPITYELQGHIEDIKKDKMIMGFTEEESEEMAVNEMGNPKGIGKKLNKIHRPKLEWRILLLVVTLISIKLFLNFNQYLGEYNVWKMSDDVFFIVIGLLIGIVIYFLDYRKIKKFSNFIYIIATGILIFQWINWRFDIDRNVSMLINSICGQEKNVAKILNMRLWYVSMILYIISFAGNLDKNKKINLIAKYLISVLLLFFQSNSITNSAILIMAYVFMIALKMSQNNNVRLKNIIFISFVILLISISMLILLEYLNINVLIFHTGFSTERLYNSELLGYKEEINNVLNNLNLFGETNDSDIASNNFTNTNSQFLQILGNIGMIPTSIIVCFIMIISIILIKDLLKIQDSYGKILIFGLGTLYIIQSTVHILMNLNILPISDVNLPLLSDGNLFFIVNVISFAIIMSVYRRKDIIFESEFMPEGTGQFGNINL